MLIKPNKIKAGDYTIVHYDFLSNEVLTNIESVENLYEAKYIGEFSILLKETEWSNFPVAIFYTQDPHPKGSNYIGIYLSPSDNKVYITNGISVSQTEWTGVVNEKNEILYSAFRHDYQKHGDLMVDGGKDYLRSSMHPIKKFRIVKGEIEVLDSVEEEI